MKRPWVPFPLYLPGRSATWPARRGWPPPTTTPRSRRSPSAPGRSCSRTTSRASRSPRRKNPNYWNKPYPYLDEIEFRVIPDALTRAPRSRAGDVGSDPHDERRHHQEVSRRPRQLPDDRVDEVRRDRLHAPARHAGGLTAHRCTRPLRDGQRHRQASASSTRSTPASRTSPTGRSRPASSATWRTAGSRSSRTWPRLKELVADYKAEHPGPLNINLSTTQDATNLIIAQAQQQFFTEAGFDDVQISQIEQAKYILTALQGHFEAFQWRNHGGVDLDAQYIWWHSSTRCPSISSR